VVLRTGVSEPDEILKQALLLLGEITKIKTVERHTEIADINDIKRNINQLKSAKSEPARRLLTILDFKYRSIEEFVRNHPATAALLSTTKQILAPATILFISQLNHDAEAIRVISDKLARIKFTTVMVEMPARVIPQ
jgi:septal ring factor EnvC (AmiA/AmiB activator)